MKVWHLQRTANHTKHGEHQFDSFCWRDRCEKHHEFMMIMMRLWCRCLCDKMGLFSLFWRDWHKRHLEDNIIQYNPHCKSTWIVAFSELMTIYSCGICLKQLTLNSRFTLDLELGVSLDSCFLLGFLVFWGFFLYTLLLFKASHILYLESPMA